MNVADPPQPFGPGNPPVNAAVPAREPNGPYPPDLPEPDDLAEGSETE